MGVVLFVFLRCLCVDPSRYFFVLVIVSVLFVLLINLFSSSSRCVRSEYATKQCVFEYRL